MRRTRTMFLLPLLALTATAAADREVAGRIVGAALVDEQAWRKLEHLTDRIGARLSGSEALERAVTWAVDELRRDGADEVWTETVRVPRWVRGVETGRIVEPAEHALAVSALGMSEGTPEAGVTAEVVEVDGFDDLDRLDPERVRGRIVLFNRPIERNGGREHGYGSAVGLRHRGAVEAARRGAVAMLIRSLGTADFRLPHTGSMGYEDGVPRIPAAAISAEDADLLHRLLGSGDRVRVHLRLGCRTLEDVDSANVVADLRGRELPDEVVLIGAHLDSWDVGTGAIDDGAGVVTVMEALRLLRRLDLVPRRTVRVVLFTNEENGLRGATDYVERHAAELARHVAAVEVDSGAGAPLGYRVSAGEGGEALLERIASHLGVLGAGRVASPGGGADISRLRPAGVPQIGLWQDTTHYFDYHHTVADTLDKVDPHDLRKNVAALTWLAWSLAESEDVLPRLGPEPGSE